MLDIRSQKEKSLSIYLFMIIIHSFKSSNWVQSAVIFRIWWKTDARQSAFVEFAVLILQNALYIFFFFF